MLPSTTRRTVLALTATGAVASLAGCETLSDGGTFPDGDWPMAGRDPANTACVPDATVPASLEERWSHDLGDWPVTSPVVGGGRVFVADETTVRAFDATDGTGQWAVDVATEVHGTPGYDAETDRLYVASYDRTTARRGAFLHAFQADSGDRRRALVIRPPHRRRRRDADGAR
jgi:outer membrane protein assembly factor BamB